MELTVVSSIIILGIETQGNPTPNEMILSNPFLMILSHLGKMGSLDFLSGLPYETTMVDSD